jgi:hypothetical protein
MKILPVERSTRAGRARSRQANTASAALFLHDFVSAGCRGLRDDVAAALPTPTTKKSPASPPGFQPQTVTI